MIEKWIWPKETGIVDLTGYELEMSDNWLRIKGKYWQRLHERLKGTTEYEEFVDRLYRELAIESNLIEGVFKLDRGITEVLVERGISSAFIPHGKTDRSPELVADIVNDTLEGHEWLTDRFVKNDQPLSTGAIKELHQFLTRSQASTTATDAEGKRFEVPLLHGEYKKGDNQVRKNGHVLRYCPPEHVASEIERLLQMHAAHENSDVAPETRAAWLHHRFTQIHPFQDGNGRVARCLAGLVFIKAGLFPLLVRGEDQGDYIDALENADSGNLSSFIHHLADAQCRLIDRALDIAPAKPEAPNTVEAALNGLENSLAEGVKALSPEVRRMVETATLLFEYTEKRLTAVLSDLKNLGIRIPRERAVATAFNDVSVYAYALNHPHNARLEPLPFSRFVHVLVGQPNPQVFGVQFAVRAGSVGEVMVAMPVYMTLTKTQNDTYSIPNKPDLQLGSFEFYVTDDESSVRTMYEAFLEQTLARVLADFQSKQ